MRALTRTLRLLIVTGALGLASALPLAAQDGLFAPALTVNNQVITNYELQQRARLLTLLNARGDVEALARDQLIDNKLQLAAAEAAGIRLSTDEVLQGMEEFAARAEMTREDFVAALVAEGVSEQTFRDFIRAGFAWRSFVRARFASELQVDETAINSALFDQAGGSNVRVLLSEIIMPITPQTQQEVTVRAERIAELTSVEAFSAQAERFSVTPSRVRGGRLDWQPLDALPPVLRPIVLGLAPGEVSDPLPIDGGIALFQLRALDEVGYTPPPVGALDYAALYLPGGRSAETLARAADLIARSDRCDDLYGLVPEASAEQLERAVLPPSELPAGFAGELARLDPGEVSTALTRNDGQTLVFLMLCARTPAPAPDVDLTEFTASLRNQRLENASDAFLAQLRAEARIETP